jgi:hypothetical protein
MSPDVDQNRLPLRLRRGLDIRRVREQQGADHCNRERLPTVYEVNTTSTR